MKTSQAGNVDASYSLRLNLPRSFVTRDGAVLCMLRCQLAKLPHQISKLHGVNTRLSNLSCSKGRRMEVQCRSKDIHAGLKVHDA